MQKVACLLELNELFQKKKRRPFALSLPCLHAIPGVFTLRAAAARGEVLMLNKCEGGFFNFPRCQSGLELEMSEQYEKNSCSVYPR